MLAVYGRVANDAILVYERVTKNKRHLSPRAWPQMQLSH